MGRNLVNWQDVRTVLDSFRTGSVLRILRRLVQGRRGAVKSSWERVDSPQPYLWSLPSVHRRVNRLVTGDPDVDYITHVSRTYLSPLQPLRGLSLGCGTGHKDLEWTSHCRFDRLDAYDLSASRIEYARSRAEEKGREEICYHVGDVPYMTWPEACYDVIFADQSLHHFSPLEPLLVRLHSALRPSGYLVASEFIGPSQFQWTDRQLEVINGVLAILPHQYRRGWADGRIKQRVYRPSLLRMRLADPSEAVESDRIVPLLEHHFEVVERRDYGCTILHMLLHDIAGNFVDDEGQEKDEEACRLLDICFQIEDALLELGDIQSDFALLVCRRTGVK